MPPFFRRLVKRQFVLRACCCGTISQNLSLMTRRLIIAALVSFVAAGLQSHAPAAMAARAQAPAPFDGNLQRLAEIMGALHYLRALCGANEGQKWRNEVQALIDAEAPSGDPRTRMIRSFNRRYT